MSPNQNYLENLCEKYNASKDVWETIVYDGFGIPFIVGSTVLSSDDTENLLLLGGSENYSVTKIIQSMTINDRKNLFDITFMANSQDMEFNRANSSVCMMKTDNPNEKIALIFGGVEEHEPLLSLDAVRIKYQKG